MFPSTKSIGAQKYTAIRYNACGMNMPMGYGRGGGDSRSFSDRGPYERRWRRTASFVLMGGWVVCLLVGVAGEGGL